MTALPIAIAALLLHCLTASRYGYFRDELYFIACSKHLAWGYVDQPPLVAIAALFSAPFDYRLAALRFLPAVAASLAAIVSAQIAKDLGGGRFAQIVAAIAVALTPAYLLLGNVLTTTSFEGLSWTLVSWCVIRIVRGGGRAWWIALAFSLAFGFYGKYSMGLLAIALIAGLLLTRGRTVLATPDFALCAAIAAILLLPNIVWQASHGWPFFEVLRGDAANRHALNSGVALEYRRIVPNAFAFAGEQLLYTNPVAVPLWLTGLFAPLFSRGLRDMRFATVAYGLLFIAAVALEAKGYYIIGAYATLLAFGAVVLENASAAIRFGAIAAIGVSALATLPLSIPILPIGSFVAYSEVLGMTPRSKPHVMQPVYAEEFGWEKLARDVATVYRSIAPDVRSRTAIYADTYADAGAIDLFGAKYGLPNAIGSQNTYWLWGPRKYDGQVMIAIGASRIGVLSRYYRSVRLVATSGEPLKWVVEGPAPIYLCTHPIAGLDAIWPHLRWYGA